MSSCDELPEPHAEDHAQRSPSSPSSSSSSRDTAQPPAESPSSDANERRPKRCKISREQLAVLIRSFEEEPSRKVIWTVPVFGLVFEKLIHVSNVARLPTKAWDVS